MIEWHIEKRKISSLKDHPKNPRKLSKHDAGHLKESLEKFGLADKPIITKDGLIIGGHQRKRILKQMGFNEIDCMVPDRDLSQKEIDELNIRLNRNLGECDYDKLANEWNFEDIINWVFIENEFDVDGSFVPKENEEEGELLEPKKDEDAITKLGDVYELISGHELGGASHRIICGDSTDPFFVDLCLNKEVPILMVTDPPYGVEYDPKWRKDIKGKFGLAAKATGKVRNDDTLDWSLSWNLFPGSVAYVWCASLFSSDVQESLKEVGFQPINLIIWVKQHFALSRGDYHWQHEPCWYAVKKGHKHNWQGARDQSTVWEIANLNCFGKNREEGEERTAHSTQKPIECMARPIRNNTAKGEIVYDPFIGSGTTLIAAEMLGRNCYGIEISPAYVDICVERWIKYMNKNEKPFKIKKNGEDFKWHLEDQKNQ